MVTILYFASLKEKLGLAKEMITLPEEVKTAADLVRWLSDRGDTWSSAFAEEKNLKIAINQSMSAKEAMIKNGDEIALFPPVTGG
jgi:molybdopterin synthase sulfur carrier subunit